MGNNKGNIRFITPKHLTFTNMLVNYWKENELISIFHLTSSLIIGDIIINSLSNDINSYKYLFNSIQSISTDILAILIAAFGLFAAITDIDFSKFILKMNQFRNFLFPFWLTSTLWLANIFISLIGYLSITNITMLSKYLKLMTYVNVFGLTITAGYTLGLIGDILKTTINRVQMNILGNDDYYLQLLQDKNIDNDLKRRYYKFLWIYISITLLFACSILINCFLKSYLIIYLSGIISCIWLIITYKFYTKSKNYSFSNIIRSINAVFKLIILALNCFILYKIH